jgi:hypothetical protein
MGVGFRRTDIVDGDHLDIRAAILGHGAKRIAADSPESVDCYSDCHEKSPGLRTVPYLDGTLSDYPCLQQLIAGNRQKTQGVLRSDALSGKPRGGGGRRARRRRKMQFLFE